MGALLQRLQRRISHGLVRPALQRRHTLGETELRSVPVTYGECEGVCEPTATQINMTDREHADQFDDEVVLRRAGVTSGAPSMQLRSPAS